MAAVTRPLTEALREMLARQPPPASVAARESRAAVPPPDGAAVPAEADMAELVDRMRVAVRQASIDGDGPLTPLLEAFMLTLGRLGTLTDRNARISADHAAAMAAALDQARRAADAETGRFRSQLDAATAETIRDVAHHIARSADAALTRRVRVLDRNSVLIAAAVLVVQRAPRSDHRHPIAQVDPQGPPAPSASLRAKGASLRGRVPPVDYLDNPRPRRSDRRSANKRGF